MLNSTGGQAASGTQEFSKMNTDKPAQASQTTKPTAGKVRRFFFRVGVLGMAIWAIGGWFACTIKLPASVAKLTLPVVLNCWPAMQMSLELEGRGFGANARPGAVPISFLVFCLWALLFWIPLLSCRSRKIPIGLAVMVQAAVIVIVSMLFFRYGNG